MATTKHTDHLSFYLDPGLKWGRVHFDREVYYGESSGRDNVASGTPLQGHDHMITLKPDEMRFLWDALTEALEDNG